MASHQAAASKKESFQFKIINSAAIGAGKELKGNDLQYLRSVWRSFISRLKEKKQFEKVEALKEKEAGQV